MRTLQDKIVLIGIDFTREGDEWRTPLTLLYNNKMTGAELHAQMLAQILDNRLLVLLTGGERITFLIFVGLSGFVLSWFFWRSKRDYLDITIATAILVLIDAVSFRWLGFVLPITLASYIWFICVIAGHQAHTCWSFWARQGRKP